MGPSATLRPSAESTWATPSQIEEEEAAADESLDGGLGLCSAPVVGAVCAVRFDALFCGGFVNPKRMEVYDHGVTMVLRGHGGGTGANSSAELRGLAQDAVISRDTLVRKAPDGAWVLAERVQGLFSGSDATPPPAPFTAPTREQSTKACPYCGERFWPSPSNVGTVGQT